MKQYESEDEDNWYLLLLISGAKQRNLEKRGRSLSRKQAILPQKELPDWGCAIKDFVVISTFYQHIMHIGSENHQN